MRNAIILLIICHAVATIPASAQLVIEAKTVQGKTCFEHFAEYAKQFPNKSAGNWYGETQPGKDCLVDVYNTARVDEFVRNLQKDLSQRDQQISALKADIKALLDANDALTKRLNDIETKLTKRDQIKPTRLGELRTSSIRTKGKHEMSQTLSSSTKTLE